MRIAALMALGIATIFAASSAPAFAWGVEGHAIIGQAAVAHMPSDLPAFVRTQAAKDEIVYLQAEEDRLKLGEGDEAAWTREWTTDHYLDIGDDGEIGGAVSISALPATRDEFEQALDHATPPVDAYKVGFLPYAILEGYEQVRTDFALWRFAMADAAKASGDARQQAQTLVTERERLVIHDIGIFSHFVGDGSQPLHVSVHYNGWGKYPNPNGFSEARTTHANFEDLFVAKYESFARVTPFVGSAHVLSAIPLAEIEQYLVTSRAQVVPFYELEKAGAFKLDESNSSEYRKGVDFAARRLAAASEMLNSLILTAWQTSTQLKSVD